MKYYQILSIFILFFSLQVSGQTFTDSNLPIVLITTDGGASIPDEPGILGNMKIIFRGPGQRNYLTDQNTQAYLVYDGRIDIEKRGSSSQSSPKRNYGLTTLLSDNVTNNNVSLLGMPAENDWILGGMVFDTALIRDYICDNLSRQLGNYASRTVYCEVMVNGDYKGLFLLQEKIKADDNRVDVKKIKTTDIILPDLSGGYITKSDKTTGGDPIAWTMDGLNGATADYIHVLPKPEEVTVQQNSYIKSVFFALASASVNNRISAIDGYPSIIDIPSFIDYMIINELASNPDAYQYSTFFHKDKNGKLRAGPIWDMDLTFGNDLFQWDLDRSKTYLWYFQDYYYNNGSRFWYDLFNSSSFRCYLSRRWNELIQAGQPLSQASIEYLIDNAVDTISEAVARDYSRWGKTGSHAERIADIKSFIAARRQWISQNIGSYSQCNYVPVPDLVITKIMYHPVGTAKYPDPDDLEFIEIRNNTDHTVNLTGFYFLGTGFVFQFPANSSISANARIILASDKDAFKDKYGFAPFGQYTRQLSNNGQKIILGDAWGNIIDIVYYTDASPWPAADGNGYYLKLIDANFDNSLASNWEASDDVVMATDPDDDGSILTYPNPATEYLTIQSISEIGEISLYDILGRLVYRVSAGCDSYDLDMRHIARGTYIVRVTTAEKTYSKKIIRK